MSRNDRQHRWITVPSALVLFASLFLPLNDSNPFAPIKMPLGWPPYVLGLLVGIAATSSGRRQRGVVLIGRILMWLVTSAMMLLVLFCLADPRVGKPLLAIPTGVCIALLWLTGLGPREDESAAARLATATGLLGVVWFGVYYCLGEPDIDLSLSTFSSIGLLLGGAEWRRQVAREQRPADAILLTRAASTNTRR
jgi:peptidoglycan/LPS O-acetylase OafA/YrhL